MTSRRGKEPCRLVEYLDLNLGFPYCSYDVAIVAMVTRLKPGVFLERTERRRTMQGCGSSMFCALIPSFSLLYTRHLLFVYPRLSRYDLPPIVDAPDGFNTLLESYGTKDQTRDTTILGASDRDPILVTW